MSPLTIPWFVVEPLPRVPNGASTVPSASAFRSDPSVSVVQVVPLGPPEP